DHYECFPSLYRKETVKVDLDKETINAMIYIMNEGKPLAKPSNNYYTIILKGYNSFGFDVDFLKQAVDDSVKARNIEKN
ncbi:MAG: gamma-glutamylcyclotransferase, partial [Clostridia bacterium]